MNTTMTRGQAIVETARHYRSLINADVARGYLALPRRRIEEGVNPLDEAIRWICRAQDAAGDGGVARSYALAYLPFFRRSGWLPSYPETTGYIIPTMFDYAHSTGRGDVFDRAVRMTDWECDVQMSSGAVQGGTIDQPPTPAVFNTGQVIFGWVRAFEETRNERYLAAAMRAGDFLLRAQDADGAWRRHLSRYASERIPSYTYNTRTAWALLVLAHASGRARFRQAAVRNVEFALREQLPNGWFRNNCLYDPARPLVHTIAYSLRGVLEVGLALNDRRCVAAVEVAADALLRNQRSDGSLAGKFDERWRPSVRWSCLTGNAQMGLVWGRLYEATGSQKYLGGLAAANRFLRRVQWLDTGNPGLDGGISGSHPLHGLYGRFEVLNWAVKFFADSLMLEARIARAARDNETVAVHPAHVSGIDAAAREVRA
ncbi:MAG TPA: hypothetical protein VK886_06375 [Vicinamibacterales bacterium]|nr:hypothetical protein [Vicinamibacterales bacterium]